MNKYVLITGASGGIGAAVARQMASQGYHLFLHYNQNRQSVIQLKEELKSEERDVKLVQADLGSQCGADYLITQLSHPVASIIHNSGSSYVGLLQDMGDDEVETMIQLNLTSPIQLTKKLLPQMIQARSGKIIVISSIWGLAGASCEVVYSTVKGGLNSFVKALAKEVAPSGIQVNAVAPGAISTSMLDHFSGEDLQAISEEIPMGRLGHPEEVANLVSFLHSNQAEYINGQVISVNGAWHC
ncbi:elongation factor P 5-aminopentanone reductase [Desertibacillus haloalkaliphilus]|uniref:elongation factor P 5-aminopentanone reductase n=1 Tax=Desertibacillus haloalkaliphilus TaxID=1328930 RepID=UPI001C2812FA|nr:SDR family oxidoreductase [Desertibacillus haloalkaliphilus]MBU8907359.1 SDR family oxidoreductase [Desertibacillus haloalkaliphilus]